MSMTLVLIEQVFFCFAAIQQVTNQLFDVWKHWSTPSQNTQSIWYLPKLWLRDIWCRYGSKTSTPTVGLLNVWNDWPFWGNGGFSKKRISCYAVLTQPWKKWYHSQTWNEPFWEPLLTIIYGEVGQSSRCNLTQLGLLLLTPETGPLRILWPYGLGPNLEKQQKMPWISQNTRKTAAPCSLSAFHIDFPQCRPGDGKNTAEMEFLALQTYP